MEEYHHLNPTYHRSGEHCLNHHGFSNPCCASCVISHVSGSSIYDTEAYGCLGYCNTNERLPDHQSRPTCPTGRLISHFTLGLSLRRLRHHERVLDFQRHSRAPCDCYQRMFSSWGYFSCLRWRGCLGAPETRGNRTKRSEILSGWVLTWR